MVKITSSEKQNKENSNQGIKRKKPWYKKWWGITMIIIVAIVVVAMITPDSEKDTTPNQQEKTTQKDTSNQQAKQEAKAVSYEIVSAEDISHKAMGNKNLSDFTLQELENLPMDKRFSYRIVIGKKIKRKQVRPTVEKIISDLTTDDPDIDEIHLLLYSTEDRSEGAYDVAMAEWSTEGETGGITPEIASSNSRENYKISIEIKEDLEEYLQKISKEETKFGLTQQERKQIFNEVVKCEDKAVIEAEKYYSSFCSNCPEFIEEDLNKETDMEEEIMKSCKEKIRAKYDITEEQQSEISLEAIEKDWPLPEPLPDPECCGY